MLILCSVYNALACNKEREKKTVSLLSLFLFSFFIHICHRRVPLICICLVEETNDLTTCLLVSSFLVVHDTVRCGEHNVTKLSRGQEVYHPLLHFVELHVESGGDATALVQSTIQVNNHLSSSVVIDHFELFDVTVLLHALQELDSHLGDGSEKDLSSATLFGVV